MLDTGVIFPSKSPWTSPLVSVQEKDGTLCLCVDYRKVNKVTTDDKYPMPKVDELLEKIGRTQFISTLDLITQGYYQVSVKEGDREKTAFATPMAVESISSLACRLD